MKRLAVRMGQSALDSRGAELLVTVAVVGVVSVVAASSIATMGTRPSKTLIAIVVVAVASVLLSLSRQQLFLGWLFAAPLLQESATATRLGHPLSLALYTAPPLALLAKMLSTRGPAPKREWFDLLPAAYVVFVLGSLVITATNQLRFGVLRSLYQDVALGVIVYYLVAFWRGRLPSAVRIVQVVLLASALQGLMAAIEWPTHWNLWHDTSWQGADTRSIATLGNPDVTGTFIGVGIVIALAVLAWQGPSALHRLAMVTLVVGIPGLYATKTRGPILATAIAALLCLLLSARSRVAGLAVVALVALTLVVFWPQIHASSTYRNRFQNSQNVQARLVLQDVSIRLAEKKPLLGWGYGSFDRVKYDVSVNSSGIGLSQALQSTSHNTYLTILVEFGAFGLVLFLLPWVPIVWRGLRWVRARAPDRWFVVGALASVLVIAIDAGTLDYRFFSFAPMLIWLFLGLVRRQTALELREQET